MIHTIRVVSLLQLEILLNPRLAILINRGVMISIPDKTRGHQLQSNPMYLRSNILRHRSKGLPIRLCQCLTLIRTPSLQLKTRNTIDLLLSIINLIWRRVFMIWLITLVLQVGLIFTGRETLQRRLCTLTSHRILGVGPTMR